MNELKSAVIGKLKSEIAKDVCDSPLITSLHYLLKTIVEKENYDREHQTSSVTGG